MNKTEEKKSEVKVPEKILLTHLRGVLRQFKLGKTIMNKEKRQGKMQEKAGKDAFGSVTDSAFLLYKQQLAQPKKFLKHQ